MALTDLEARSLQAIAVSLRRSDPRLAAALARGHFGPQAITVVTVVMSVVLAVTLCIGVVCRLPVLCAAAWAAVMVLTVLRGMFADGGY